MSQRLSANCSVLPQRAGLPSGDGGPLRSDARSVAPSHRLRTSEEIALALWPWGLRDSAVSPGMWGPHGDGCSTFLALMLEGGRF